MRFYAAFACVVWLHVCIGQAAVQKYHFLSDAQAPEIALKREHELRHLGVSDLASCLGASCLLNPEKCLTTIPGCIVSNIGHGDNSDSWFGSGFSMIEDWFLDQTGATSITGAVTDIVKQCMALKATEWLGSAASIFSKVLPEEGPYDALVCDVVGGASKDGFNFKDVSVGQIGSCTSDNENSNSPQTRILADFLEASTATAVTTSSAFNASADCSKETFGIHSIKDFFSEAWATIKKDDENSGVVGETFSSLKACWADSATPKTTCMGAVFVGMACSSSCDMIDCEVRKLYANGDEPCRKALKASCKAAFASANTLCKTVLTKASLDASQQSCATAMTCKAINAASPVKVSVMALGALLVVSQLV